MCMGVLFPCMSVYYICAWVYLEVRTVWTPRIVITDIFCFVMWVLGNELRSSERTASVLSHITIFPASQSFFTHVSMEKWSRFLGFLEVKWMPCQFFSYLSFHLRSHEEEIKNSSTNQHEGWDAGSCHLFNTMPPSNHFWTLLLLSRIICCWLGPQWEFLRG